MYTASHSIPSYTAKDTRELSHLHTRLCLQAAGKPHWYFLPATSNTTCELWLHPIIRTVTNQQWESTDAKKLVSFTTSNTWIGMWCDHAVWQAKHWRTRPWWNRALDVSITCPFPLKHRGRRKRPIMEDDPRGLGYIMLGAQFCSKPCFAVPPKEDVTWCSAREFLHGEITLSR